MLLEMLPYIAGAAGLGGVGVVLNDVPLLPGIADARLWRSVNDYTSKRYGVELTKPQALSLCRGEEIFYEGQDGEQRLTLLRPGTPLDTRDLVRNIIITKTKNRSQPEIIHQTQPYPELKGYGEGKHKSAKEPKKRPEAPGLSMLIQQLRAQLEAASEDLPPFFAGIAVQIFDLLDEMVGDFDDGVYSVEQKYTIEATIRDYLPTLMQNATDLPRSFFRNNANSKPAQDIHRQLKVILEGISAIHQAKYDGIVRAIEEQGLFLDAKFAGGGKNPDPSLNLEQN